MDGCTHVGIPEFSYAKAYTCVAMNLSSREFRDKYTSDNNPAKFCQMNSMINISGGKMAAFPGGILLRNRDNDVLGAIGVSGASGDEDEYVCLRSVWDSGLNQRNTAVLRRGKVDESCHHFTIPSMGLW
ncbi:hypothetical protein ACHAW5_008382 [Stephanodiscus triporus]|uniref:Uncharacterized protein n=1 Tax=Stephanodiscus triporus TaxID=2934178 RepID=A0ABD3P2E3_9STRA